MAFKIFPLISFLFLIFILLAPSGHAKRSIPSGKKTFFASAFDFIKKLKGCHKGNTTKGIHELKAYLEKFGYLRYPNKTQATDDDFDDILESAVKTYQENYHIKPSGIVDDETISKMTTPRCGVPDIINGTNYMHPRHRNHKSSGSSGVHVVSHYSFFDGEPKWPPSKTHLTYGFLPNFPANAVAPVARAFQKWQSSTHFTFARAQTNADLVIGFYRGDHGDGAPFDGPLGDSIAHAFAPPDGRFHYDADETWSIGAVAGAFDLETVALHEIGHLLGLGHSMDEAAIMYATIGAGGIKNLNADDIQGIRDLYNI